VRLAPSDERGAAAAAASPRQIVVKIGASKGKNPAFLIFNAQPTLNADGEESPAQSSGSTYTFDRVDTQMLATLRKYAKTLRLGAPPPPPPPCPLALPAARAAHTGNTALSSLPP
jgi:hypothetical protein